MTIDRGKLLKTIGWSAVGVGLYLVGLGGTYGEEVNINRNEHGDDIIDADFTIIEE
jgi:hypothetical protein